MHRKLTHGRIAGRIPGRLAVTLAGILAVGMFLPTAAQARLDTPSPAPLVEPAVPISRAILTPLRGDDVVSSAHPSTGDPQVTDTQWGHLLIGAHDKADSVATASSICDGCGAQAVTATLVRSKMNDGPVRADNVATAWAACTGCTATAVSVQVVTAPSARDVHVNNRALAVNSVCDNCRTSAAAVQYVLIDRNSRKAQIDPRKEADAIVNELADDISAQARSLIPQVAPNDNVKGAIDDIVEKGRQALQQQLPGGSVQVNVDVQTG